MEDNTKNNKLCCYLNGAFDLLCFVGGAYLLSAAIFGSACTGTACCLSCCSNLGLPLIALGFVVRCWRGNCCSKGSCGPKEE